MLQWISQNSGGGVGDVESWGSSEGTSGVPEAGGGCGPLTSCPFTMGKAALILLSQAQDLQAGREGSVKAKITSPPWKLEVRGGS